ncbi:FAD-dependent oxidoreductase [Phaeacidiphilus oryzae]|uniref:FAD-dependent oxidoreductase n=1 Tax=Phaeacidiphilus oryzae TaxID=348818 RepID=UPI00055DB44E|nr:FAD-dependent oxidoreductase [Phaeacidiphilus oryzae]
MVVVGAGAAGLAAARQLAHAGLVVDVLEASRRIGGRMAAPEVDGFRLENGALLVDGSLPELGPPVRLAPLELRPFAPGVLVAADGRRYRVGRQLRPREALGAARTPIGGPLDKARLSAQLARLAATPVERLLARPETSAASALAGRGLPDRTVDGFLRPLLVALLSDPALAGSSRSADLALRRYARGALCLPSRGLAAIPEQLAEDLPPGAVRTGVRVTAVAADGVETERHGRIACRAVVVATGARDAVRLLPGLHEPAFRPVTTYYHAAPASPLGGEPLLVLDGEASSPVAHSLVLSDVSARYARDGRALVATTVLGEAGAELEPAVRRRLAAMYGRAASGWEFLTLRQVPEAVAVMTPPHHFGRPVRLLSGLYACGAHRDSGTVAGALDSALRAAAAVRRDLGFPATEAA